MGSWSESCGLSGIEIGEGEYAYVAFLGAPKYKDTFGAESLFEMRTPLLRGTYNDYGYLHVEDDEGVIALFNHLSGLSLKNGDDFEDRDDHAVEGLDRYWIRADVFDSLANLKPEFPYYGKRLGGYKSIPVKNIGDAWGHLSEELHEGVAKTKAAKEKWQQLADRLKDLSADERFDLVNGISGGSFRDLFGYGRYGVDWHNLFSEPPEGITHETLIEAYRRSYTLTYSAIELRKKIVPSERIGPQHSGELASCQFARSILAIQKERKKRWED